MVTCVNNAEDCYLFRENLLLGHVKDNVPEEFKLRPLHIDDYNKGYLELLGQLTTTGDVTETEWIKRFNSMKSTSDGVPQSYYIAVIEDLTTKKIVGSVTLVIEFKFIHHAGCRGRIEDVVTDKNYRGRRISHILNRTLVSLAKELGVYKLSLECKDSLIGFYGNFGFKKDEGNNFLVQRFDRSKL
ncbi:Glucosamine 6-phosphate N-acetyltransferase [Strongyloides ratti]|uniref:Glucosamine 6-phosphate N-acetyltransferase n=1 Tax=Strongyloides ratti TaxID=34506 RepID=A0A090LGH3_STRRB|nr:Glucosamine 6-phosphate N-acetyltransferase [Strongyloides ratti]CEF68877.1 Glucosamine 6-phosphate N-acetyltransferase [Strongyloides ratti]